MQEICPREKCTGCAACYNVCPKNCIQMKENEYGEVQPFIAEKECIDCGSCRRVCPNVDEKYISLLNPKAEVCYAAARKELQKQPRVASGGIATFLMEKAFLAGWKVFGTALDQEMIIEVKELKSLDEMEMFQGSRYVQSNVGDSFKKIKEAVKQGRTLFIGTPCQVAGIRALCGKNAENLYTCDLVCHGVNPQSYLWEELKWKNKDKNNLTNITFRGVSSTEDYWLCLWKNGTKEYTMNIILLSGGSGKRLWPLSNDVRSKQFIKLFKNNDEYESMVQRVYRQITTVDADAKITIATSKSQASAIKNQLGEKAFICVEPCRRDTFPAIALAAAYLHDELGVAEDEAVIVCPVDPYPDRDGGSRVCRKHPAGPTGTLPCAAHRTADSAADCRKGSYPGH